MAGFLQTSWSGVEPPFEFTDITTNFDYPGSAQIFVQEQSGYFSSIELFLVKFDSYFNVNSTVTAYVVGLLSGKPNISDIKCQSDPINLVSLDIPSYSILDEELSRKRFIFSSSSHLTAGTEYAIILSFNYAASDPAVYINTHTGGLPLGIMFPYGGAWYPNGDMNGSTLRYRLVGNTQPITYATVNFYENPALASTSGSVPTPQTNPSEYPLDIYLTTCDLLKTGYLFTGWNTVANGSGTHYANSALIVPWFSISIDLYAQWEEIISATLTFNGNGSDYGQAPSSVSYAVGQPPPERIPSYQTNSMGKIGCMFIGWTGGGGSVYSDEQYINPWFSSNVTFYAQWSCGLISVIYDGNGEDSGKVPSPTSLNAGSSNAPLSTNINNLAKTEYFLLGWNTRADGTGTNYYFGDRVESWFTETTTVYALWATNTTVTYDGTGTSGYLEPTTAIAGDPAGRYLRSTFESTPPYEKSGYIFAGWNTAIDNTGDAYDNTEFIVPWFTTDKTLYAQWAVVGSQVTVTYNGNGSDQGTVPTSQTYVAGDTGQVLLNPFSSGNLAKTGHFFYSWNTKADGSGKIYSDLQLMMSWFCFSLTLYAQWKPNVTLWSSLEIPEPKTALSTALVGTKLLFAGGSNNSAGYGPYSDRVYIYDIVSNSWSQLAQNLFSRRYFMASATIGSKVIFAGGVGGALNYSSTELRTVDIYDFTDPENPIGLVTEGFLPVSARHAMSSAVVGNKAIFAGGYNGVSDLPEVCVYDVSTEEWTTITPLTIGRSFMTSSVITTGAHTLVMFAGGYTHGGYSYSDVIDVYDFTNPESPVLLDPETSPIPIPSALSGKRAHLASAVIGNMVIFAGGEITSIGFSSAVEIFDMNAGVFLPAIQVPQLSLARSTLVPAVIGNLVIFAGGLSRINPHTTVAEGSDVVDIYDFTNPQNPTKTTSVLPMGPRSYLASAVYNSQLAQSLLLSSQNTVFFAGGCRGDIYGDSVASVDVFTTEEIVPPEPLPPGYELFTFDNMKFDFYIQENIDFSELSKVAEIVDLTKL